MRPERLNARQEPPPSQLSPNVPRNSEALSARSAHLAQARGTFPYAGPTQSRRPSSGRPQYGAVRPVGFLLLATAAVALLVSGCRSNHHAKSPRVVPLPVAFVAASPDFVLRCHNVARAVGYRAPCPMLLPRGLRPTQVRAGPPCHFQIVGLPCSPPGPWKGWIVGSSEVAWPREHLVIAASPVPVPDYAKVANGPGWYPGARVSLGGSTVINGWRARWVFVTPATNDGSAFAGHVVLVWTTAGHTYAVGFHDLSTRAQTRAMDLELVRHMRLVSP
jgi:hypothetical protein